MDGRVIGPADSDYDQARSLYNGMINVRPALIARCAHDQDVRTCLAFADEQALEISVRGGGHNAAGTALCEGLVIDLSQMRDVSVDPERRWARVGGGATWADLDTAAQRFGLACPGGVVGTTGVGGLTLGAGIGWLSPKYGLSCDNLLRAEVVTADGQLVFASEAENNDLLWGLKGGGGNFGVVTAFEFQLHHVRNILGGFLVYALDDLRVVLDAFLNLVPALPDSVSSWLSVSLPDPSWSVPDEPHVIVGVCGIEPTEEKEALLSPLHVSARPVHDTVGVMSYLELQDTGAKQPQNQPGRPVYWKAEALTDVPAKAVDSIVNGVAAMTSPLNVFMLTPICGAVSKISDEASAVSFRNANWLVQANAMWTDTDTGGEAVHIAWARELWENLVQHSAGTTYLNFLADVQGPDLLEAAYGVDKYRRLAALKQKFDPANRFRPNQNVLPLAV